MNQNCIHDALNLLDDAMIETVDVLRNRPVKMRKILLQCSSLAAVLCIVFAGIAALQPKFEAANDSSSILYGEVKENLSLADKAVAESSVKYQAASSPICVKILELTDNGFFAEVIANHEPLDGAVSSNLTVIFTNSITEKTISGLKVGDIVDVLYGCDPMSGAKIYAYSIHPSSNE